MKAMKIKIQKDALCGAVPIRAGEYWVALRDETREIALIGQGKDVLIPAIRRSPRGKGKTTSIQFYSGGGTSWSLIVSSPQHGEWLALIDYDEKAALKAAAKPAK